MPLSVAFCNPFLEINLNVFMKGLYRRVSAAYFFINLYVGQGLQRGKVMPHNGKFVGTTRDFGDFPENPLLNKTLFNFEKAFFDCVHDTLTNLVD